MRVTSKTGPQRRDQLSRIPWNPDIFITLQPGLISGAKNNRRDLEFQLLSHCCFLYFLACCEQICTGLEFQKQYLSLIGTMSGRENNQFQIILLGDGEELFIFVMYVRCSCSSFCNNFLFVAQPMSGKHP
jgi:hypothetical protein